MSKAGIQSNRGDGYQTLVAFDWALTVLSDPDYQWIEVDSVTWFVDDVVIGKTDGSKICCQCKKNQTTFRAWSISELSEELKKAISLLEKDQNAVVHFYSRSNFGDLAALREYSTSYCNESDYNANLGLAHKKTDSELANLLADAQAKLSTYDFLCRTAFFVSDDLERMQTLLHERLRQLVSNPPSAFSALWTNLDHLGMRVNGPPFTAATRHRLSKEEIKKLLIQAGAMLIPSMDIAEVLASFSSTSAIGRAWRRDIGDERISSPLVEEILSAIDTKTRSILLTGLPGSGKTCTILTLLEELEQRVNSRSDLVSLFIQSREFVDFLNAKDREAQGLSDQWVERVARIAEGAHVVVVIDSLDVLSIAREHSVLTYFLAQIDRLLLIPNVTVITACRDFDRQYDRRIAQRKWSKEFTCLPLNWDLEVAPLLAKLSIDTSTVDASTRELVRNPRELALYVELAKKNGSFNVVTSQTLAQRYLTIIIQANSELGDTAMQAIEAMAVEMLSLRSLSVPHQRFTASDEIRRKLLSNNVLHEAQGGQLTFGHQTLLDVLVISNAVRRGVSLNSFILDLPPVPFVRPSIRSFVAQLASGDRRDFRKQLRAVLMSSHAFHIRRLVAESFADQIPHDEDWPLIRDLHSQYRDVFLVIYTHAARMDWHFFWFKHLVPALKTARDAEGLTTHVYRVLEWKNNDISSVLNFFANVLTLDWIDKERIALPIERFLANNQIEHSAELCKNLILALLSLPRRENSFVGRALARCIEGSLVDDKVLWSYIAAEVRDEDVLKYGFGQKLRCQQNEFCGSSDEFLLKRMQRSTALLELAVADLERWSMIKESHYGDNSRGFLRQTSYRDINEQKKHQHVDGERLLLDAIQASIIYHAINKNKWWQINRQRLCFSRESSLQYFAILACTAAPIENLDIIGTLLCNKALLDSDFSFELSTLMQATFLQLDPIIQDAIQTAVLTVGVEDIGHPSNREWMLRKQAHLLIAIPRYLRSPSAQAAIDECEKIVWPLVRNPFIDSTVGFIKAPFSFEVFLELSNVAVLQLLNHYNGFSRNYFDDFLVGGELEVGHQLRSAASRHPIRFVGLLTTRWDQIQDKFRDDIMGGVAIYLAHQYGGLQFNETWKAKEEADPETLARQIIDELEKHGNHWHHNRVASEAIAGCAYIINHIEDAARLTSLAVDFSSLDEESIVSGDSVDLVTTGLNMARGNAVEAVMILANQLAGNRLPWPNSLSSALSLFAKDKDPAIRALLLRRMPYFQKLHPVYGWELFELAMRDPADGIWTMAEHCLYYAYHQRYEIVAPWLARLYREGRSKDLESWGRISSLVSLSNHKALSVLLEELSSLNSAEAWSGAASVWTQIENLQRYSEQCFAGLEAGLGKENQHALIVARKCLKIFNENSPLIYMPMALFNRCFCLLENQVDSGQRDVFGMGAWLNAISIGNPLLALQATERYLQFVRSTKSFLFDYENNLTQLLTRLFAQAEEQEESDNKAMLQRVVLVQEALLSLSVNGVNDWLKIAERP